MMRDSGAARLAIAIVIIAVILLVIWLGLSGAGHGAFRGGRGGRGGRGDWGWWRGGHRPYWWWGGGYPRGSWWWWDWDPTYVPTPYIHDYTELRPCPADPTGGGSLCTESQADWRVVDKCRAPGLAGDAAYVWKEGPEGGRCYSYYA